jgi:hypothetical protein
MAAGASGVVTVLRDVEVEVDMGRAEARGGRSSNLKIHLPGIWHKQILSEDTRTSYEYTGTMKT